MNVRGKTIGNIFVKAISLDMALKSINPDLIKIDVEGSELEVLHGMRSIISQCRRAILIVEWNPSCLTGRGISPGLLLETIAHFDFNISTIDEETGAVEAVDLQNDITGLRDRNRKYINLMCHRP